MASDTVPAAVPGPHDPPPSTAPTTPVSGPQQGGIAGLLAPVSPTRAAFTLDPATATDGTPEQAAAGITSDTFQLEEAAPEKDSGTTRNGSGGTPKEGVVKAWLRAGAERWRKGGDARNKRLDIQKAKAQARQVKETVTVNRSEKMVGGSTNSSTGSKNNAAGKSLNSKSNGTGKSGGTGPKNRGTGDTNNAGGGRSGGGGGRSGGGRSGGDGRSGSGGQGGGGSRGSNARSKTGGGSGRPGTGHGKDSTGGRSGAKDGGSAKPSGGKAGDGSGAGPKNGPKPTGSGTKSSGGSGGGAGKSGSSGAQGPAGKPGKDGPSPKTSGPAKDLGKSSKTGPAPGTGTNTPTGTENRPKSPGAKDTGVKGGTGKVRLDKSGRTDGTGRPAPGTPGKDPKRTQDGGTQPTAKDGKGPWKPKGGGTGTHKTPKPGTGTPTGTQARKQTGPRVPAPRLNLQESREAGYRDGTRAAKTVAHIHAWRDGARDGYADTTQAAAREKTRLDKAHADRKNARTQPAKDQPVTPPATSADYQTVPPKPDHAPGPQPIPVTGTDAGHVHLGDGAARPRLSRGEVRTLRGFQQRLEAKTDTMTRAGEATRTLEQHALEQAKQVTDLLEQARSAEGGEKVVAALTQLADTARVQAGKAAETHQRAVRAGEACTVLHANTETRYGGIYQAVQDSPESRSARMNFYREMGTAHV